MPPPPEQVPAGSPLPDEAALRAQALAQRPDLKALAERIAAERASLALAHKEYLPDFEVLRPMTTSGRNGRCGRNSPCA